MGCDCRHTSPQVITLILLSFKICIHIFSRTVMRLALLSRDGAMLVKPLIPGLDRSLLTQPQPPPAPSASREPGTVRLPRSGRVLRTVAGSPPPHCPRDWASPGHDLNTVTTMLKVECKYHIQTQGNYKQYRRRYCSDLNLVLQRGFWPINISRKHFQR